MAPFISRVGAGGLWGVLWRTLSRVVTLYGVPVVATDPSAWTPACCIRLPHIIYGSGAESNDRLSSVGAGGVRGFRVAGVHCEPVRGHGARERIAGVVPFPGARAAGGARFRSLFEGCE